MAAPSQNCAACKYFRPEEGAIGVCHRYPPQRGMHEQEIPPQAEGELSRIVLRPDCNFPLTLASSWCGEFDYAPTFPETKGVA